MDAEGAAQPAWEDKGFVDASRYHPVGPPPPPPPPADEVLALLQAIDPKLDRLLAKFPDA